MCRTSAVTILSSVHGRLRRAQRSIEKIDLQAAVKNGKKERGLPCPRTGEGRWKYTFADVVYITDESSRQEITSWPSPGAGLDFELYPITRNMKLLHEYACSKIRTDSSSWTSHTVMIVDQSGSMRITDVAGGATRSDAVWLTLATDFVASQLETKQAKATDVVSIVGMNQVGTLLVDRQPTDWILFNRLIGLLHTEEPKSDGNYLPALKMAEKILRDTTASSCALMLLVLSDGKPSDHLSSRIFSPELRAPKILHSDKIQLRTNPCIDALVSQFGRRLAIHTISFAGPSEDFAVLRAMAARPALYGCAGKFQAPSLTPESLGLVISELASSLTSSKSELSHLDTPMQKEVRRVLREPQGAADDTRLSTEWFYWDMANGGIESREHWCAEKSAWVRSEGLVDGRAAGVAMRRKYFGEGAERLVAKFREVGRDGLFVGPKMVAKESRFAQDMAGQRGGDLLAFHKVFCVTQARAARLAEAFNRKLSTVPGFCPRSTPRVRFLDCFVYVVNDDLQGQVGVLVEEQLDPTRYKKWNSNNGFVDGADGADAGGPGSPPSEPGRRSGLPAARMLPVIEGSEDSDGDSDGGDSDGGPGGAASSRGQTRAVEMSASEIPQAFSHFTYRQTCRRMLVCDLQGVLTAARPPASPPVFELTDPVIHYRSLTGAAPCPASGPAAPTRWNSWPGARARSALTATRAAEPAGAGRKNVYGRTDGGKEGMHAFLKTHRCGKLCRALNRRWGSRRARAGAEAEAAAAAAAGC